ncbi:MAG: HemK/PrmC family methyltransferase [candidate division WOR-3 bacterium]|nr:peptide chain release factor N(5)-glutamine methyltransferase [candidate division WOR-3 bacterium]MDW8150828.1 HemK/PrmC family methyltransferase [candidate division WOR-3 bacterium]
MNDLEPYEIDFVIREVLGKTYIDYVLGNLKPAELEIIKPYLELAKYKPVEYIFNKAYFRDLVLYVNENVLIPRNETEQLVDIAMKIIIQKKYRKILEIGTGSGAIAISLAKEINNIRIWASDISYSALDVARKNIIRYNLKDRIFLCCSDSIKSLKGKFDMIIWNVPYVFDDEYENLSTKVKCEPKIALIHNEDSFNYFLHNFQNCLLENGSCLLEISPRISNKLRRYNFTILKDYYGNERFSLFLK